MLRSQASALTKPHFQDTVSDTDAILGVLVSKIVYVVIISHILP